MVTTAPAGCGTGWLYGVCNVGTPAEGATAPDWMNDAYDTGNRYTGHPANIRAVVINIVARAMQTSPDKAGDPVPAIANRPARPRDSYVRSVLSITEQTSNLLARAQLMPAGGG